jgi:hypothetical protein
MRRAGRKPRRRDALDRFGRHDAGGAAPAGIADEVARWLRSPLAATNRSPGRTRRESAAMPVMSASAVHDAPITVASSLNHLARRRG